MRVELIGSSSNEEVFNRIKKVAAAGKLSRFPGTVFDVLDSCDDYIKNVNMIKRIIGMGHKSIIEHDYLVFAISDVTPIVEQTLIGSRLASFTIKSRREVDFSKVGYYIPDFSYLENSVSVREKYCNHMDYLFKEYEKLVNLGIKKEDARFVLPYSYHSNIIMGIDVRGLEKIIKSFTSGKLCNIAEIKELGYIFKDIALKYVPYLEDEFNKCSVNNDDCFCFLDDLVIDKSYDILDKPKLISYTENCDDVILESIIMNRYQFDHEKARNIVSDLCKNNENLKYDLMNNIYMSDEQREFEQINFKVQIPISLAVLTHLTRHRMHSLLIPDFIPMWDLTKYKIPPVIKKTCLDVYNEIYFINLEVYKEFKQLGVKEEDLIYFYLSGNMCNVTTTINGRALIWISKMRCCTKAQWEIRNIIRAIVNDVKKVVPVYGKFLGATCDVLHCCNEGKESCGRIKGDNNER